MTTASPTENGVTPATPQKVSRGYPFRRLLVSVFLFAMLWLAFWAALFVSVAQFVLSAFDSDASEDLSRFGGRLGVYMGEIVGYMTFAREAAPFPFASFPKV